MQTRHQSAGYLPLSASKANTAPEKPPKCVVRQHAGLSFWTITETPRGRWVSSTPFDVPLESYGDGWRTGYAVALELTNALRSQVLSPSAVAEVIEAAFAVPRDPPGSDTPSRRGAACALRSVVSTVLASAASVLMIEDYIKAQIADLERGEVFLAASLAAYAAQAKTATVERMRLARAAKSAKAAKRNEGGAS